MEDGQDARPTRNKLNTNELITWVTAYCYAPELILFRQQ
jgi:hypothetical protein